MGAIPTPPMKHAPWETAKATELQAAVREVLRAERELADSLPELVVEKAAQYVQTVERLRAVISDLREIRPRRSSMTDAFTGSAADMAVRDLDRALELVHRAQGAIDKHALSSLNVSPYMELTEALFPLQRAYVAVKEIAGVEIPSEGSSL